MHRVGVDIGSISVDVVVVDRDGTVLESRYVRHKGRAVEAAIALLREVGERYPIEFVSGTGTGARLFAEIAGASLINEVVALSKAFSHRYPHIRSVIDIGGEDSKLVTFDEGADGSLRVKDFSMNALCAAGTGSFLDQQASRLRFTIEEFSEVALKSRNPPRIAGRCTVFAKSDMIHLQQIATPDYEIIAGLCHALARNFKSNIAKGKDVRGPIAFIGGVAANAGMRRAIATIFDLNDGSLFVPEDFAFLGALGAVYAVLDEPGLRRTPEALDGAEERLRKGMAAESQEPLEISEENRLLSYETKAVTGPVNAYLGVDVGSISTNLVVVDEGRNLLAKRYLMTEGRPLEAVKRGLAEIGEEIGPSVRIVGVGTTGSGRYLTADFIGADIVRNEITAQAEAAINIDTQVDTIFEIGGQDSKYISIDNGVIVDFEMNKACAAGTGSFLEEQAERLGISIKKEFGDLALSAQKPVKMGERCTVFIESDLIHHQQRGARTDDLVAGLSYSIAANYLNKVVGDRRVGRRIFFQGGTAFNKGVVAAFEKILKRPIKVPPHHDVTGAIGVAILALKERDWESSSFKGFDLSRRAYSIDTFECKGCENLCEIRRVTVESESPLFYGSRCEKYDVVRRSKHREATDYFKIREDLLYGICDAEGGGDPIGVPLVLYMHEMFPFWKSFLTELGFTVVPSEKTNKRTIRQGVENIIVETCFPVKLAHGHILNLLERGIRRIFLPSLINLKSPSGNAVNTYACPYAQSLPYTVKGSISFGDFGAALESPVVHLGYGRERALRDLCAFGKRLGRSRREVEKAFRVAAGVQEQFQGRLLEAGNEALQSLSDNGKAMIIVGRPYNSADAGANLNLHRKLIDLGVTPIPMDMLPISRYGEDGDAARTMYWGYGRKILQAAHMVLAHKELYPVYVTNFGCGPDSFITHFFKRVLNGKPYLQLEIDEHSADAGIVTRLEAFLDSVKNARVWAPRAGKRDGAAAGRNGARKIFLPFMSDHAITLVGAFRACGVDAEVLPESDEETVHWGRKFTTGKECYPCILTTGDMVKAVRRPDFNPHRSAFFMPSGEGPCRFGQYHRFHRLVLDDLGFEGVPIYSPNQDHRLYQELHLLGSRFSRLGWKAIVATDLLVKLLHETRPYELAPGEADRTYRESLEAARDELARGGERLPAVVKESVEAFCRIKRRSGRRPIVGIVGEIYIRSNRFGNSDLIRAIEALGGQAWLAPIGEWILYVNYIGKAVSPKKGWLSNIVRLVLTDFLQKKDEHELEELVKDYLSYGSEPKIEAVLHKASPYIHESFRGEAVLSVGKAVDFAERGVSGIVNAMPFTCMPGTISSSIMKLLQHRYDVPIINVAYDGQAMTNIATRLEAFMYQVKAHPPKLRDQ